MIGNLKVQVYIPGKHDKSKYINEIRSQLLQIYPDYTFVKVIKKEEGTQYNFGNTFIVEIKPRKNYRSFN